MYNDIIYVTKWILSFRLWAIARSECGMNIKGCYVFIYISPWVRGWNKRGRRVSYDLYVILYISASTLLFRIDSYFDTPSTRTVWTYMHIYNKLYTSGAIQCLCRFIPIISVYAQKTKLHYFFKWKDTSNLPLKQESNEHHKLRILF